MQYFKEYKNNILYIYISRKLKLNTENLCHAIIRNFFIISTQKFKLSNSRKQILPLEGISFYFSYLYADLLVYRIFLILCLYSSVFSVIAAIAKQSQFHPGGFDHPVTSSPLQIQRARTRVVLTIRPPFLFT